MKVVYAIIALLLFSSSVFGQERERWDIEWNNTLQPYGEETDAIVTAAFAHAKRQLELSSNIDINFLGFNQTPITKDLTDCIFGFVSDKEYADLTSRNLDELTKDASALGNKGGTPCSSIYRAATVTSDVLAGVNLHELGHMLGMNHPIAMFPGMPVVLRERYRGESIMWGSSHSFLISETFTIHDRIQLAELGWGVNPNNPNLVPAEAVIITDETDDDYLRIYVPVVELGGPGGEEAWLRLDYEGTTTVIVDGRLEERHQWGFDPNLVKEKETLPNGLIFSPAVSAYGYLKDLGPEQENSGDPTWYEKYEWRNPAAFYEQSETGILEIPIISDASGNFEDIANVVFHIKDMDAPLNDKKLILRTVSGIEMVVE